jgi:glutaredoxin-like YruB-family protein
MKNHNVIVYSTSTCPYCIYAKNYFKDNNVQFKDVNVSEDYKGAEEMIKKSGQRGVPVIDIDGHIIVGFQPEVFEQILKQ